MAQYVVKKGDNLSSIARKLGLSSYRQLSGYRSGNPNLIYPGEVLSYGGGAAPAAAAPAAAAPAVPSPMTVAQGYFPDYARVVQETGRPEIYELTPQGNYVHIPNPAAFAAKGYTAADITQIPSFGTYYREKAQKLYDPIYAPQTAEANATYDTLRTKLGERLKGEYAKRGILESGIYGKEFGEGQSQLAIKQASDLSTIQNRKESAIQNAIDAQFKGGVAGTAANAQISQNATNSQWDLFYKMLQLGL